MTMNNPVQLNPAINLKPIQTKGLINNPWIIKVEHINAAYIESTNVGAS